MTRTRSETRDRQGVEGDIWRKRSGVGLGGGGRSRGGGEARVGKIKTMMIWLARSQVPANWLCFTARF